MVAAAASSVLRCVGALTVLVAQGCADSGPSADSSCTDGDERQERHGTDCLCCHEEFSVAGSIRARGAVEGESAPRVMVRDAGGVELAMAANPYGNFFRHLEVTPPLAVTIVDGRGRERRMVSPAPHGSCNRCHAVGTALGPLTVEGP